MNTKICAVIVTYNPDFDVLFNNLEAVLNQVDKVFIVDNGSLIDLKKIICNNNKIKCLCLGVNKGVANGFNKGIKTAKDNGYEYVILLDQDSCLPIGALSDFKNILNKQKRLCVKIAAIGPRFRDIKTGKKSSFVRFNWFFNVYDRGLDNLPLVPADFLISSGSFYSLEIFDEVGMFKEELFIDHVDTEWCHRATNLGFKFLGVRDVIMDHSMGEGSVNLWCLRWFNQPIHKPFRLYYITRNSILLYRMPHVPVKWISGDLLRLVRILLVYVFFSSQRVAAIRWYFRGLLDGLRKVTGPAPNHFDE